MIGIGPGSKVAGLPGMEICGSGYDERILDLLMAGPAGEDLGVRGRIELSQ